MRWIAVILMAVVWVGQGLGPALSETERFRVQGSAAGEAGESRGAGAGAGVEAAEDVRFVPLEIVIDSGERKLAAYQFELTVTAGDARIVGVEGGEHAAFAAAPYYDPAALMNDRIIVAAFNTGPDLPAGVTRVARLHMRVAGETEPEYAIQLTTAASADGDAISAEISIETGEER